MVLGFRSLTPNNTFEYHVTNHYTRTKFSKLKNRNKKTRLRERERAKTNKISNQKKKRSHKRNARQINCYTVNYNRFIVKWANISTHYYLINQIHIKFESILNFKSFEQLQLLSLQNYIQNNILKLIFSLHFIKYKSFKLTNHSKISPIKSHQTYNKSVSKG